MLRWPFVDRTTQTWSSKRELPQNSATLPVLSLQRRSTSTWWFVRPTSRRASRRSVPVAWSHDEPHDQSDQDEQQHAHTKPSERTHSISKTTHHGELLLLATSSSRTPPMSRQGTAFAARNHLLLAQEFSTTYSSGSMSSPVTARAGQCSASIATHRAPRRDLRASWLCSRRSGMASRSSSDSRASLVSSGAASPPAGWRAAAMWPRTRLYRRRYGAAGSPTLSIPVRGGTASRPRQRRGSSPLSLIHI